MHEAIYPNQTYSTPQFFSHSHTGMGVNKIGVFPTQRVKFSSCRPRPTPSLVTDEEEIVLDTYIKGYGSKQVEHRLGNKNVLQNLRKKVVFEVLN